MRVLQTLTLAFLAAQLSGCIIVPLPEAPPFRDVLAESLQSGVTTRADVVLTLGGPRFTHEQERVFVYDDDQSRAGWLLVFGAGSTGGVAAGTVETQHLLIVEFDDRGVLMNAEAIKVGTRVTSTVDATPGHPRSKEVCTAWGLCTRSSGARITRVSTAADQYAR